MLGRGRSERERQPRQRLPQDVSHHGRMERLCALEPNPREHLRTYHGALAPASSLWPKVVGTLEAW